MAADADDSSGTVPGTRRKTLINQLSGRDTLVGRRGGLLMPWAAPRRGRPSGRTVQKRKRARKRKMSAAARKRISDAQKKRWAKAKRAK